MVRWDKEEVQTKIVLRDKSLEQILHLTVFDVMPHGYEKYFINKIAKYQTEYEVIVRA